MLTTMRTVELLDESDHVANMVLQSDVAENYRQCLYRLKKDSHAQALIAEFVKIKEQYEDVQRFGKYHPDYKTITRQVRDVKRQVDLHATIAAFKKAENELQKLLDEISVILGQAVSEHVKVPTGNPFFDTGSSCGGGCGSGGSCGCSA
ncbi:YlbF family regulator [Priestia megaterium]|uniref:YlbF family regulator n=2 Tax=Priestia TaxID=2800373 RepID=A0AAX6N9K3_PRIAR|nr:MULTISPECIES: YlbF family regulator [Priestia]MBU8850938.1 YlbF family regulator [Bacillus sp. FJAT-26377]AEN87808.1 Regulatory protein ylbF [Priestia megaterium WSH-002]MBY0060427.1 YlbF family regulator [Priestia aryabhattai]MDN3364410.1 YlbF family regulator [Priestia megaterium]MDU9692613.1 YlbF family regulator [Priestia aryabhattai]